MEDLPGLTADSGRVSSLHLNMWGQKLAESLPTHLLKGQEYVKVRALAAAAAQNSSCTTGRSHTMATFDNLCIPSFPTKLNLHHVQLLLDPLHLIYSIALDQFLQVFLLRLVAFFALYKGDEALDRVFDLDVLADPRAADRYDMTSTPKEPL